MVAGAEVQMTARKSYFRRRYEKDRAFREERRGASKAGYRRRKETLFMRLGGVCSVCGKMAMRHDTLVVRWANDSYMPPGEQARLLKPSADLSVAALFCKYNRHLVAPWLAEQYSGVTK